MAFENFIGPVWSSKILEDFRAQGVLVGIANREYEGALAKGREITIPGIAPVTIKDYAANNRITEPDELAGDTLTLTVDQEKNFDFLVDDIDRVQSVPGAFDGYTRSGAIGLYEDAEAYLTGLLATQGTKIEDATAVTDFTTAHSALLKVRTALNLARVPMADRYAVINPAMEALLLSSEGKLASADVSGDSNGLREATIGRLAGFNVVTNVFDTTEAPQVIGLGGGALAYVSQIEKIEAMRAEKTFADRIRGLHVYGGAVIRPNAVQVYTGA